MTCNKFQSIHPIIKQIFIVLRWKHRKKCFQPQKSISELLLKAVFIARKNYPFMFLKHCQKLFLEIFRFDKMTKTWNDTHLKITIKQIVPLLTVWFRNVILGNLKPTKIHNCIQDNFPSGKKIFFWWQKQTEWC